MKPKFGWGFFCSNSNGTLSTNHKIILKNLNEKKLMATFERNCQDFITLLELSKKIGCTVFRLGSNFIPFFTHPAFKSSWVKPILKRLIELRKTVSRFGVRITMHPSQFVVLNSDNKKIVDRSLKELRYHFFLLDGLGIDRDGVVVVHLGKGKINKGLYLQKFIHLIKKEKWLTERLAIENDDLIFTASDCLYVHENTGLPLVFDLFHHKLNPSAINLKLIIKTWQNRRPKFHLSSQREFGRIGEHGDYVGQSDIEDFLEMTAGIANFDVIIEAKAKEKAVVDFRNKLEGIKK